MDTLPRQTLSQTIVPPTYSSRGPFVTPQNHLPKRCMSSLPFSLLGRQFKCDFCATWGSYLFFPRALSRTREVYTLVTAVCFSLVDRSLVTGVSAKTKWERRGGDTQAKFSSSILGSE